MAVFGIGAILLLLFLLGCTLAVIVAVGAAVVHGRFALAAVIGGGAFVFVIVAAVVVALFAAVVTQKSTVVVEPSVFKSTIANAPSAQFEVTGPPQIVVSSHGVPKTSWHINLVPALFLVAAVAFVLVRFAKHHFAHAAASHGRAWPVLLVIPALVFLLSLSGFRYQAANKQTMVVEKTRTAAEQSAEINAKFRAQAESLSKQQQDLAKRVAELTKNIQQRIDNTDIHELMDEFDAPRIVLRAPFASMPSPAAMLAAAAPSAFDSFQKSATALASGAATQSTKHSQSEQSQIKSKKKSGTKPAAVALAKMKEQPPALPAAPAPPAPPAPTATTPVAELPAGGDPASLLGESPSDDKFDLYKPEGAATAAAGRSPANATKKPGWINNPPKRTGDVRREVIATEEYATADECYRAADINLMLKTYDRLQELEGQPYPFPPYPDSELPPISFREKKILFGGRELWNGTNWGDYRLALLNSMGIDPDFLRREIIAKDAKNSESCEYIDTVERSVGPMKKLYVQIEFTPAVDRQLMQHWDAFYRRARFKGVGLGAFSVFGLLSIAWGLLKADTATKGYYTKWLFVGVPIAIIGVTALSLLAFVGLRG